VTVKPNRGAVAFFVLLAIVVAGWYGYGKHAQSSFHTDGPPAHSARRLLRCMLGRDAQRVLGDRPTTSDFSTWTDRATDRLRRIIAQPHDANWPSRCEAIADRLSVRLAPDPRSQRASARAAQVRDLVAAAVHDPITRVSTVETGALGGAIAALAFEMSALSVGAEEGWNSPLPFSASDLYPLDVVPLRGEPIADGAEYPTLVLPDLLLYQSATDRRLHRVTFDANERATDRALARGAPVARAGREGAALIADDAGDAIFLPGGEPAEIVPLPHIAADGPGDWQIALTPGLLWLLTVENGTLHLFHTSRSGEVSWVDTTTLGEPDTMLAGLLAPGDGDTVRVVALRRGASGVRVDGYTIDPQATARPVAEPMIAEWSAFGAQSTTCSAGRHRFAMIVSDDEIAIVETDGMRARVEHRRLRDFDADHGGQFTASCTESDALVYGFAQGVPRALHWNLEAGGLRTVDFAPVRAPARLVGAALAPGHAVIALVDYGRALRVFRTDGAEGGDSEGSSNRWVGGELVALETPPAQGVSDDDVRAFDVAMIASQGNLVAVLGSQREGRTVYSARIGSHDGGQTFRGAQ
jgi:hypothetical protein